MQALSKILPLTPTLSPRVTQVGSLADAGRGGQAVSYAELRLAADTA
jgi:hypothetical protein